MTPPFSFSPNSFVFLYLADEAVSLCSHVSIHYVEVEQEESDSILEEARELRRRRQMLSRCEPQPDLVLVQPVRSLT